MKYIIDENICKEYNLTADECLLLTILIKGQNIYSLLQSLVQKNFISQSVLNAEDFVTSDKTAEIVSNILIESEPKAQLKDEELTQLTRSLQEIFPKGKKPGTTYYWRGNTIEITRKLKTLAGKYNVVLNPEKVLSAARHYVNSFNGDYTKMRLLKYFILKAEKDSDGNIQIYSDLKSLLENEGQDDTTTNRDWTTELV